MENIAIVVLDTLRQDFFNKHFDWLPGQRFDNAWAPSHWTLPVHGSMFTGKYPSEIGVYSGRQSLDCEETVLAEQLQDAGYTTTGLSCNLVVSDFTNFDRGFDHFERIGHQNELKRHSHDPEIYDWSEFIATNAPHENPLQYLVAVKECITSDCSTLRSLYYGANMKFGLSGRLGRSTAAEDMGSKHLLQRLRKTEFGSGEFLYLNLMEAHSPYTIPEEYKETEDEAVALPNNPIGEVDGQNVATIRTRYNNACRYLSDVYRDIFDELAEDFDCIITLSDHGELLGEYDLLGHAAGVYPQLTNVALSVYAGKDSTARNSTIVSLLDVHRTALAAADLDGGSSRGRNLFEVDEDQIALSEYHGPPFLEENADGLREWGGDELGEAYEQWRRGIAMEEEYYGFETPDGWTDVGSPPCDSPSAALTRKVDELDIQTVVESDQGSISRDVKDELASLGYLS